MQKQFLENQTSEKKWAIIENLYRLTIINYYWTREIERVLSTQY